MVIYQKLVAADRFLLADLLIAVDVVVWRQRVGQARWRPRISLANLRLMVVGIYIRLLETKFT